MPKAGEGKSIRIDPWVYNGLLAIKRGNQSFSNVIEELKVKQELVKMTNINNAIATMTVSEIAGGLYVRIPSGARKTTGFKAGDRVRVYVGTDRNTIRLERVQQSNDIINLDEPVAILPQVTEKVGPVERTRLSLLMQRLGL